MKKTISISLTALALLSGVVGCGAKDSESKSKNEPSTAIPSTANVTEETTIDWQKLHDDYQDEVLGKDDPDEPESGIIKHTNREYEGYYLEDYITVEFKGYEHDSECEVIVDWDKIAEDLGNGVTSEMLETIFHVDIRNTEDKFDRFKMDDLVNGDMVVLYMDESTKYETYEMKYPKEMEYIDKNLWYYEETPVIVSKLKTKTFVENTSDIDKAAIQKITDEKMNEIKDSAKDYVSDLDNDYAARSIMSLYNWKLDVMGNTHNCKINDFTIDKTYFAKRTASSYKDTAASTLPENMVFNIYKLSVERYGTGEILDLYYRAEIGNLLYEDGKMVISDDTVKVQFAITADDLMPDSKYWEIEEVK